MEKGEKMDKIEAMETTQAIEEIKTMEKIEKIEKIGIINNKEVEEERNLAEQNYYDGSGFFNYDDYYDWSHSAIKPESCYNT